MLGALSSPPLLPAQQSGRSAEKARRLCCWRFFVQRVRDVMRGRTHAAAVVCVVASAAAMAERKQCGNRAAEPSRGAAVRSPWNGFDYTYFRRDMFGKSLCTSNMRAMPD